MQVPINVETLQAVQAIGSGSPAGQIEFKPNEPNLDVYFCSGATVQDYGSGTAIRFGLVAGQNSAAGALLVQETTFTRMIDAEGLVFYRGIPQFDTDLLLAALGANYSILCSGEIRFQKSDGSIQRTLDILFTIIRWIIPETTIDELAANFVVPAINSDVPIVIGDTGWLRVGQTVTIATAGKYIVHTITDGVTFEGTNTGASGNAAAATTITAPQTVGSTPPTIPATFPDPSTLIPVSQKGEPGGVATLDSDGLLELVQLPPVPLANIPTGVELTANRNTPGGYPSTDSQGLLAADAIPADGTSVVVTTATITRTGTTASGSLIVTGLSTTADLTLGQPVSGTGVPGGATVLSIDAGGTQIHLSTNATASGSVPLAFTSQKISAVGPQLGVVAITTEAFTVPTVGGDVTLSLPTANLIENVFYVIGNGAGTYQYVAPVDSTHGSFQNVGGTLNAAAATTILQSATVIWSGPPGQAGTPGTNATNGVPPWAASSTIAAWNSGTTYSGSAPASLATYLGGLWLAVNPALAEAPGAVIGHWIQIIPPPAAYSVSDFVESPTAETRTVDLAAASAYTIVKITIKLASGTCTAALNRNGTGITGATAIAVTSTLQAITLSQVVAVDDLIELVVSSPSSAVQLSYAVRIQP